MGRWARVGDKREVFSADKILHRLRARNLAIKKGDREIVEFRYEAIDVTDPFETIALRNNNGTGYKGALEATTGKMLRIHPKNITPSRRDMFAMIYSVQHKLSQHMVFDSTDILLNCPCATRTVSLFPATHVAMTPGVTVSSFSSCTHVKSGAKSYAVTTLMSVCLDVMINDIRDPRTGLEMYMICPLNMNQIRNWVGSGFCGHTVDNSAFYEGHMQDNPRYDPSDFVAVIHHNTQKTISPHSGRVVETAGQLVFDVGMEIGIGFPTLGDMLESTVKIFSQMDKYPGQKLQRHSTDRHKARIQKENQRLQDPEAMIDFDTLKNLGAFQKQALDAKMLTKMRRLLATV